MGTWLFILCLSVFAGCFCIALALWSLVDAVNAVRRQGHSIEMQLIGPGVYFTQQNIDRQKGRGEFGWSMMCVDCGADMPISKIHAKMAFDLMMRTKGKPQPRCPKCAESFVWAKEGK
jgi:hypothetical protein